MNAKKLKRMKERSKKYRLFFLKGTQVNHQWTCKPVFFIWHKMKYTSCYRFWRFQITVNKNL